MNKLDYLVILTIIFALTVFTITKFLTSYYADYCGFVNKQEALLEMNPFNSYVIAIGNFSYIYGYVIVPAICIVGYLLMKKYYTRKVLEVYVWLLVAVMFINVLNDMTVLLATLIRAGIL